MSLSWGRNIGVPAHFVKVTTFPTTLNSSTKTCRGLHVGTAGAATLKTSQGTLTNFPLQAGLNPGLFTEVTSKSTADDIWAVY